MPRLQADRLAVEVEQVETEQEETRSAQEKLRYEMAARAAAYTELQRSVREENARAQARKGMLDREPGRDSNELTVDAPCTGTVLTLRVQSPGAVVHESDVLAEVVCAGARLQAELRLPQQGLARVGPGQPVKLMYDAFPYQRYGVRYGTVRWVSPASGAMAEGASFRVFAELEESAVRVQGETRPLAPGMGGRAAIIVGTTLARQLRLRADSAAAGELRRTARVMTGSGRREGSGFRVPGSGLGSGFHVPGWVPRSGGFRVPRSGLIPRSRWTLGSDLQETWSRSWNPRSAPGTNLAPGTGTQPGTWHSGTWNRRSHSQSKSPLQCARPCTSDSERTDRWPRKLRSPRSR